MGIREKMNENPAVTTGVTVAVLVVLVAFILYQVFAGGGSGTVPQPTKAWFTTDDGNSYFPDDINKLPPFKKDGKDAYRAYVFQCKDGKKFVAWVERYTLDGKKRVEQQMAKKEPPMLEEGGTWIEVKPAKTGDKGWVKLLDEKAAAIRSPTCPDGSVPQMVQP